jgi:hypothetical protein
MLAHPSQSTVNHLIHLLASSSTCAMVDPYTATPLDFAKLEFRLLRVQPGAASSVIKCTLQTYSLADNPSYVALSYTWGPARTHDFIELNGVSTPVRETLWCFLHRQRERTEYGLFWVDAVCINQSKVLELNHQVQMMGRIYGSADSVSVWLGNAHSQSDIAMGRLRIGISQVNGGGQSSDAGFKGAWTKEEGQAILLLFNRGYWRRMWVIQEVLLAKNVIVHCGSHCVDWNLLEGVLAYLRAVKRLALEFYTPSSNAILASPAIALLKTKAERAGNPQPLRVLVRSYTSHESTDVRDKVYSLLGIADDASGIIVDYKKSAKDVLLDVLAHESRRPTLFGSQITQRKGELMRLRLTLQKILKVKVAESELHTHVGELWDWSYRTSRSCLFSFLGCSFRSLQQKKWKDHCMEHFGGDEPPRSVYCSQCKLPKERFLNGWAAWNYKLEHMDVHLQVGDVEEARPDRYLLEHLWQKRLLDDLDLEELLVGKHNLSRPPLWRTQDMNKERMAWEDYKEECKDETCRKFIRRPVLPPMDEFRCSSWDEDEGDYILPKKGVIEHILSHVDEVQRVYQEWREEHSHETPWWHKRAISLIFDK